MKDRILFFAMLVLIISFSAPAVHSQVLGDNYYDAFISVDNGPSLVNQLESAGVQVTGEYDGFLVARIPSGVTPASLTAIGGVKHVTLATPLVTCSDSARYYSRADAAHQAEGFKRSYTGKGVIVGVIDCGFDFNHINLCDENGNTRVKAVYMPLDDSGNSPVVKGLTLPGSCYETASAISQLTTDDAATTHGTQTAGIAAGGFRDNGWYGMAPDADIVACGMPEDALNDVRVANCISYIIDYANRAQKPCVINISLGSNVGPHDGTSFLTRVFNQVTGSGRVIVVSAGNDGDHRVCMRSAIENSNDTVTALLSGYGYGSYYSGTVSAWSKENTPFGTRVIIVNKNDGEVVYTSDKALAANGEPVEISSASDIDFGMFFNGQLNMSGWQEATDRYTTNCSMDLTAKSTDYVLGVQYFADAPVDLVAWTSQYAFFERYGFSWAQEGTAAGSISDLATTDSVISVGSYNSRQYVPLRNNTYYHRSNSRPMELSYYSSYGPDENGNSRPDVCAPGSVMIASANRYDTGAPNMAYWQPSAYFNGVEYPYCPDLGTSMSAPVVTGAIALWLQADPNLTVADIRDILAHTCYKDDQVLSGNSQRWGNGKLDASAGIRYMLVEEQKRGDVNIDGNVNLSDIYVLINILISGSNDDAMYRRADVNRDGIVNISDLNVILDIILSL